MAPSEPQRVERIDVMRDIVRSWRSRGQTIALVPTMGFLHDAHAALLRRARTEADCLVLSIFVNPTQFGPGEDLERYPRDLERDAAVAASTGVDVIFTPTAAEMYPDGYQTWVEVTEVTRHLCGHSRPGHFRGVTTVVAKLFNIVTPDVAVFGEKDYQQWVTIRRMVSDLNMNVRVIAHEIVREDSGLALSSRNAYLSEAEREAARVIQASLTAARASYENGERSVDRLTEAVRSQILAAPGASIDYVDVVDAESIQPIKVIERPALLAVAVRFGTTRLIDNVVLS